MFDGRGLWSCLLRVAFEVCNALSCIIGAYPDQKNTSDTPWINLVYNKGNYKKSLKNSSLCMLNNILVILVIILMPANEFPKNDC